MTNREFCIARRKTEVPKFVRVLKAIPRDRLDYRPHAKSRSAAELAWVIAAEEAALVTLLDTGTVHWKDERAPASLDHIVDTYERSADAVDGRLVRLGEAAWDRRARLLIMDGSPAWEDTIAHFVWGFLFDAVHHRGQLTVYLRPMGGKVPAIYGPSADEGH
jgi:uncharacterized damage-inducible protein DinB